MGGYFVVQFNKTSESSAQKGLDGLAAAQDKVMQRLERAKVQGECGPKLNKPRDP